MVPAEPNTIQVHGTREDGVLEVIQEVSPPIVTTQTFQKSSPGDPREKPFLAVKLSRGMNGNIHRPQSMLSGVP